MFAFICSVGDLLSIKKHQQLCEAFEEKFPRLFNFEKCGLLFIDADDKSLYKIAPAVEEIDENPMDEGDDDPEKTGIFDARLAKKPLFMRLPKDRGITGLAISRKIIMSVHNGEYCTSYAPEVDNVVGLPAIHNCLFGPCYDSEGNLRGVIQLINKPDAISE